VLEKRKGIGAYQELKLSGGGNFSGGGEPVALSQGGTDRRETGACLGRKRRIYP